MNATPIMENKTVMRSQVNTNFFLLCTSLLVAVLGAEVALRLIFDAPPLADGMHGLNSGYSVREPVNSGWIRGPEGSHARQSGKFRTLILGDAPSQGQAVNSDKVFTAIMKSRMNRGQDERYEVINAGTGSYGTDQELRYFIQEGKKYKPDLTVLMFYDDNLRQHGQNDHRYKFRKAIVPPAQGAGSMDADSGKIISRLGALAERSSYLYAMISNHSGEFLKKMAEVIISSANAKSVHVSNEYSAYRVNPSEDVVEAWSATEKSIERLKKETASAGSELVVFYVPKREVVYPEKWEEIKRTHGMSDADWDITLVRNRIRDICARNRIRFMDPSQPFRDEASTIQAKSKRLYFQKDNHWTAEGHDLAGNILAKYIEESILNIKRPQHLMLARN